MQPKPLKQEQDNLFKSRLSQQLKPDHELLNLSKKIHWEQLESEFKPLFSEGPNGPLLPVRLAAGLMILQHMFNESDENIVQSWVENPYWQHFCGYDFLQWKLPVHHTSLTRWRKRLRPDGIEKILRASALETKLISSKKLSKTICDTTVMPKVTDVKLIYKSLKRIFRASRKAKIHLKFTYLHVAQWTIRKYQRLLYGKRICKAQKPLGKLKRYPKKVLRDLDPL